jgi:hypothetical protein
MKRNILWLISLLFLIGTVNHGVLSAPLKTTITAEVLEAALESQKRHSKLQLKIIIKEDTKNVKAVLADIPETIEATLWHKKDEESSPLLELKKGDLVNGILRYDDNKTYTLESAKIIDHKSFIEALIKQLESDNPETAEKAHNTLVKIGGVIKPFLDSLAAEAKEPKIKERITLALKTIGLMERIKIQTYLTTRVGTDGNKK